MRTFLVTFIFLVIVIFVLKKFIEVQKIVNERNNAKANKDLILVDKSERKIISLSLHIFLLMFIGASLMVISSLLLDYFSK